MAKANEHSRNLELLALQGIMSSKDGRSYIARLLDVAGANLDTYSSDPYRHAYNAGKRSLGLWVKDEVSTHYPDLYLQMLKEENQ